MNGQMIHVTMLSRIPQSVRAKGAGHWAWVVSLTVAGAYIGSWIGAGPIWIDVRYAIHHRISQASARPLEPRYTSVVLIGDQEYWLGEPAGRSPLRRDYLARLLCAIDDGDPAVIAVDIDLRSPDPNGGTREHALYREETAVLRAALRAISSRRPVILSKALGRDDAGRLTSESNIYDDWDNAAPTDRLEAESLAESGCAPASEPLADPATGFLRLPQDIRMVPTRERLNDGRLVRSFALATAAAYRPGQPIPSMGGLNLRYGSYIPVEKWRENGDLLSAAAIQRAKRKERRKDLAHRIVVVGGLWHTRALGRGALTESFPTPAGPMPGAFVHANYVEALLDGRIYPQLDPRIAFALEIVSVLAVAWVLALSIQAWQKFVFAGVVAAAELGLSYLLLQNLGQFFDGFVPLVLIVAHAVLDQVRDWRSEAKLYRASEGP